MFTTFMIPPVASLVISTPHFFEYRTWDDLETGKIALKEWGLFKFWNYRLIYYSIIDQTIR